MARDIIVKVSFNADEYLALVAIAESDGLSHSALLRLLAKQKMRAFAIAALSGDDADDEMPGKSRKRAYVSTSNPLDLLRGTE